jgi:hypothetical protein
VIASFLLGIDFARPAGLARLQGETAKLTAWGQPDDWCQSAWRSNSSARRRDALNAPNDPPPKQDDGPFLAAMAMKGGRHG